MPTKTPYDKHIAYWEGIPGGKVPELQHLKMRRKDYLEGYQAALSRSEVSEKPGIEPPTGVPEHLLPTPAEIHGIGKEEP